MPELNDIYDAFYKYSKSVVTNKQYIGNEQYLHEMVNAYKKLDSKQRDIFKKFLNESIKETGLGFYLFDKLWREISPACRPYKDVLIKIEDLEFNENRLCVNKRIPG